MEFLTVTIIGLLVIISPGPDFAVVTNVSLIQGRIPGILASIGVAIANLCHVAANLLGIGVIISQSLLAFTILKILGAGYLLYIGYKGLRARPWVLPVASVPVSNVTVPLSAASEVSSESQSVSQLVSNPTIKQRGFSAGFLTSLLNPKACLFYLSFFSVILSANTPLIFQIGYGVWLSVLACIWFILVALFFTNPYIGSKLKKGKHWIERITGGALILLGLRLLGAKVAT